MSWNEFGESTPKRLETDPEFRKRLFYVIDGPHTIQQIHHASEKQLDAIAEEYGLKRNYVEAR